MRTRGSINRSYRRRRRVGRVVVFLFMLALLAIMLLDRLRGTDEADDWARFDQQQFLVRRVIDGDTIEIAAKDDGKYVNVRFIGVDAPELNLVGSKPPDYWGRESRDELKEELGPKAVLLRLEPLDTRDRYDRLLAYVYIRDDQNLNLWLVEEGHAYADRRFRHTHRSEFEQAEAQARKKQLGLWKELKDEQMPSWRRKWLERSRASSN